MRFKMCFQHDAMQCGAACLQMVLMYYGKYCTLDEVDDNCHSSSQGVSMLSISNAAEYFGLKTACGKLSLEQVPDIPFPCVLHWNQNHFVVLYKVKRLCSGNMRFYIADPAKGFVTYSRAEMEEHWLNKCDGTGVVLLFDITGRFIRNKEKERKDIRSWRFLFQYFLSYKQYFIQVFIALLLCCLLQLILPFLTQAIVDVGIKKQSITIVKLLLVGQFVLLISMSLTDMIRRQLLLFVGVRINISLVSDFFIKLVRLPMPFFDVKHTGDILQRMTDHARVQSFLTGQVLNLLFSFFSFVIFFIVLSSYSLRICAVFIFFSILYGLWMLLFLKRRRLLDYCNFEKQAESQDLTYQFITSMQEIKLQDCEDTRRWEWEDTQVELSKIKMQILKLQQSQEAGGVFINGVKNLLVTALSAIAVINGEMTFGMMLAVQYIIGQMSAPISQILSLVYSLQDVRISLERINEIMSRQTETEGGKFQNNFKAGNCGIKVRNLTFRYDSLSSDNALDNVSLDIPEGKVTAIVGASGSGKTTLLKLLLGFYHPTSGNILIGNIPISEYDIKSWRNQCGVVMQDGAIFYDTIRNNIASKNTDIDNDRICDAVSVSNIEDFIKRLPLGLDTKIGKGGIGISVGQRQRMLIARAVYKNPKFFFLDEATNSLDANNEQAIVERLERFYKGRTVLIIAHRLSTVRRADNIIVLEKGRVVEKGTHEELTTKGGYYYQLVRNQLSL